MTFIVIHQLAQSAYNESVAQPDSALGDISKTIAVNLDILNRPESMTRILGEIHIVWAVIFILVGIMSILNGYKWHKIVVVLLAGMSGVWAGSIIAPQLGNGPIAAVCLAILFAVVAWPLLKYSVALFGGLAGAFAGANLCRPSSCRTINTSSALSLACSSLECSHSSHSASSSCS